MDYRIEFEEIEMIERWHVFFSGQVQGVGFRYNALQIAKRNYTLGEGQAPAHSITGWVRNLADGRVEMMVEGSPSQLKQFVDEVSEATHGRVSDTQIERCPVTSGFSGFEIRPG